MSGNVDPGLLNKLELAGAGLSGLASYGGAKRARAEARHAARLAELRAEDARYRGEAEAARVYGRTQRRIGAQRATIAARGLEVGAGTAADIESGTELLGQLDALTIRENARREAYGQTLTAASLRSRARSINPLLSAAGTLIGEAGGIYRRRKEREAEGA